MGFIISTNYHMVLIANPIGRIVVLLISFRNNLEILCHPICNWLYVNNWLSKFTDVIHTQTHAHYTTPPQTGYQLNKKCHLWYVWFDQISVEKRSAQVLSTHTFCAPYYSGMVRTRSCLPNNILSYRFLLIWNLVLFPWPRCSEAQAYQVLLKFTRGFVCIIRVSFGIVTFSSFGATDSLASDCSL